ncbi:MAG: hypothetical protein OZX49_01390 [Immundisolibacter sp.]|nr:hypothetical protein [Immundisolibacter sp.]
MRDLCVDAADGEVHLGQPPGGVVGLLAVDGDVAEPAGVGLDELLALHEHAARAAAGVVDAALVWSEHLDQHAHHVRGRVELAAALALGAGEAGEKVLVHAAEGVPGAVGRAAERDVADQVDDLAQTRFVQAGAGVVLGQHALERGVVALDGGHGVVHQRADGRLRGVGLQVRPARLLRHPEDAGGTVLVRVFRVGALGFLRFELGVLGLEGVGDVLEEDQAQDDVLVLGRVHVVAQRVGGGPQLGLEAEVGAGGGRGGCRAGHESVPGVDGAKFGMGNPAPHGAIAHVGGEHAGGAASAVVEPVDEGDDLVVGGLVQSRVHSLSLVGL